MAGYTIRSITLHIPPALTPRAAARLDELAGLLQDAAEAAARETGLEVETTRIVLEAGLGLAGDAEYIAEQAGGSLVSLGGATVREASSKRDQVKRALEAGLFLHLLLEEPTWEEAIEASRLLHWLAEEDPSLATRIGVNTLGEPILTPYYPLAASPVESPRLTVSLTYPTYLLKAYRSGGPGALAEAAREAGQAALRGLEAAASLLSGEAGWLPGLAPEGVDLSVAPWMRESSLALVELIAGVRMPEPGFLRGIHVVNSAVARAAGTLGRSVGFNELQLPVAEDLKLKARASELETTARDLARFSCLCLAGLDLAVVPASPRGVAGLILDVAACSRAKGKPLGVRVIPVEDVEPGDKVWLDKFGETPVIPI